MKNIGEPMIFPNIPDSPAARDAKDTVESGIWRENRTAPNIDSLQEGYNAKLASAHEKVAGDRAWTDAKKGAVWVDAIYRGYASDVSKIDANRNTSPERKSELRIDRTTARDTELTKIETAVDNAINSAVNAYPPQPRVEVRTEADDHRVQALLAAYPLWSPRRVLDDIADLTSRGDTVALHYVTGFLERQVSSPSPHYRVYSQDVAAAVEAANIVLSGNEKQMRHKAATDRAESMRSQMTFALREAKKVGKFDRTCLFATGALSEFNAPEDYVPGRREPND